MNGHEEIGDTSKEHVTDVDTKEEWSMDIWIFELKFGEEAMLEDRIWEFSERGTRTLREEKTQWWKQRCMWRRPWRVFRENYEGASHWSPPLTPSGFFSEFWNRPHQLIHSMTLCSALTPCKVAFQTPCVQWCTRQTELLAQVQLTLWITPVKKSRCRNNEWGTSG